jgi:GAF domain-containing protein/nitrogen-specific signal transduction histidine kinase
MENARLLTETQEALDQQTATAEVLQVINSSPGDLAPVFDAMLEKATRLCEAPYGQLATYDGEFFRFVAVHGYTPFVEQQAREPVPPSFGVTWSRLVSGERVVHMPDVMDSDIYRSGHERARRFVEIGGGRSLLTVALRNDDVLLGALSIYRQEVRPFTDQEIALLENFAAQAVIAMENARLINETREALEQQTATAEVLQVINSSPGDLAPVFDAMLEKAHGLCGVTCGTLQLYDGETFRAVATRGVSEAFAERIQQGYRASDRSVIQPLLDGARFLQIPDWAEVKDPIGQEVVELEGVRSAVLVPLRRDNTLLGIISANRREVRPFSDKEIALLQNFAAQAVIAMENARLITETREALEQQTATAEVLQVINSSPGDLAPVFDAILEKARSLCGAALGDLMIFNGDQFHHVAVRAEPRFAEYWRQNPVRPQREGNAPLSRLMRGEQAIHLLDVREGDAYRDIPEYRRRMDLGGIRTLLSVPLRKDKALLGAVNVYRQAVRPFTDKQIALLQNFAGQAVIAMENARLITETRDALEQQTATAEVLQVINSSPGDLTPVFDAILEKAHTLCGAAHGVLVVRDGEEFRPVAIHGDPRFVEGWRQMGSMGAPEGGVAARLMRGERVVHIGDAMDYDSYPVPSMQGLIKAGGIRSMVVVPLSKDNELLGIIGAYRQEVRPFTEKQIALLQNFAAQAVIAVENARLLTETREALEQQTATAEVLQVINSSPGDLVPVFDAMLEKGCHLCEFDFGLLWMFNGEVFRAAASYGAPGQYADFLANAVTKAFPETVLGLIAEGEEVVHVPDVAPLAAYHGDNAAGRALVELGKARTVMGVALRKDSRLLGVITAYRQEVRPFTTKQIALLQNFAAQAVIAMENARLLTETREALEQQTATAEVLQVINSSPGDLAPVFDAILEKATSLCESAFGILFTYDGEQFRHAALRAVPTAYAEFVGEDPRIYGPGTGPARILEGEEVVHVVDLAATDVYRAGDENRRALADLAGARTSLAVRLAKDDTVVGAIVIFRQEVRPFTDKQIALLQNFAAQAVIAMENARLLTETREALEQQTATAEVLQVINSSPGDLAPVFDAMLEKAMRLCEAAFGLLMTFDGDVFWPAAHLGLPPRFAEYVNTAEPGGWRGAHMRLSEGADFVHIVDAKGDDLYRTLPSRRALVDLGGARSVLLVPLRKDSSLLGSIAIYRQEVRPFTDKQVALLQNFAAQAVIAMENARLLTETREALEQQTATAEVLQVINSSPGDLAPVFDAMLEKAMRLSNASFGELRTYENGGFRLAAIRGVPAPYAEFMAERVPVYGPGTGPARLLEGERVIHVLDLANTHEYRSGERNRRAIVDLGGARTLVNVSLRKDDTLLGFIMFYRQEVRPFTEKEIALLQNFAAQAVIAMENARLITETREALEQQTATAEVLQVINSSPGDLQPVFEAILEKAHALCGVAHGGLVLREGETFRAVATHSYSGRFAEQLRQGYRGADNPLTRALLDGERFVHIPDLAQVDHPMIRASVENAGVRTGLYVPLRKDDVLLGMISSCRREVRPFSEKEIALVENFAAQAVIAIENARLLGELRERTGDLEESLEYQTATSDVLKVISQSTFDLQPVFDTIVETATRLCSGDMAGLVTRDGELYRVAADYAVSPEWAALTRARTWKPGPENVVSRTLLERRVVHAADIAAQPGHDSEAVTVGKARTVLGVPLLREGEPIGVMALARQRVEPFTERQIELVRTFADQAVIAIENTRLITETREALEQQTATAEVLQVINSSPGDLAPVFDAMLERAVRLCDAAFGLLWNYDADGAQSVAAHRAVPAAYAKFLAENRLNTGFGTGRARVLQGEPFVHIADVADDEPYRAGDPLRRALVDLGGVHTTLVMPLRKDETVVGFINVFRQEVRPFSDKQIALLQSFAAQAVIAMDNARLLNEIRQRQAELRVTFDNMGDGVAMFDNALRLAAWNLNFQRILDVPDELLAERPSYSDYIRFLARRGEFGDTDIEAELGRRLEAIGQVLRFEHTRPDGRVIEVRRNAVPGGGFVIIYGDVTERKRAEAEIRAARDTAEKALQELQTTQASLVHAQKMAALGQLTAGIAHEIKNPLNFVNNFAELSGELLLELKETTAPAVAALGDDERAEVDEVVEMLRGNLDKIAEHGKRADGIVKSMLEHSRGVSGERRTVDLNALIEEALNLAYHGARAQDASFNITLERDFEPGLAPMEMAPQEMTRVFLNLFGNGFYATAKRQRDGAGKDFRPTLKVATHDLGATVEVRVRDNGTGIPPEIRDKLFQPFVTTKPTGEGTGLGLSISYEIVTQQHGGVIEVDSRQGEFTEFTIRLPRAG